MRDAKVFAPLEESPSNDNLDSEMFIELDPFPGRNKTIEYGSAISHIQTSDIQKCLLQRGFPAEHSPNSTTLRRLSSELKKFVNDPPDYISFAPIGDNLCHLLGSIEGPPGTPYETGVFFIRIDCPDTYPIRPPVCNFITPIYHPNISGGRICVNILEDAWWPVLTIQTILLSICSMLSDPFLNSPLDTEIAAEYKRDKLVYESNARLWTQKYAMGMRPSDEELDAAGESCNMLAWDLKKYQNVREG